MIAQQDAGKPDEPRHSSNIYLELKNFWNFRIESRDGIQLIGFLQETLSCSISASLSGQLIGFDLDFEFWHFTIWNQHDYRRDEKPDDFFKFAIFNFQL